MVQNVVFALAYSGETFSDPRLGECHIERRQTGELVLASGHIVACDPAIVEYEVIPFSRTVNPGRYPVTVCIVHYRDTRKQADERIACAVVQLMVGAPSTWETATLLGQNKLTQYSVDSAIGCFMDADTARLLEKQSAVLSSKEVASTFEESLAVAMEANYIHTRSWGEVIVDSVTGLNVIAFSSGWGDGSYTSYWGMDTSGRVSCLLTDFRVLPSK